MIKRTDIQELYSHEQLVKSIKSQAHEINEKLKIFNNIVVLGILDGCTMYMAELVKYISIPLKMESLHYKSYTGVGGVGAIDHIESIDEDTCVLIVDDIYDTGSTICKVDSLLREHFKTKHIYKTVMIKRYEDECNTDDSYISTELVLNNNLWIFGFGLDDNDFNRNETKIYAITSTK
jgi:hypoxanthine phosphoribosyltransferase